MTVALSSQASIFSSLDKYAKNRVQRNEMNKALIVTFVAMAALVGAGLYLIGRPEFALEDTGRALVALNAPLLTIAAIGLVWNNSHKKATRTWGISMIASSVLLTVAFTATAIPDRIPLPNSVTKMLVGVSAPLVGTSIIKYILARTESFDPILSSNGKMF